MTCVDHSFLKKQPSLHVILTTPNEMDGGKYPCLPLAMKQGKSGEETEAATDYISKPGFALPATHSG